MNYLPSRKFFLIVFSIIFVVVFVLIFKLFFTENSERANNDSKVEVSTTTPKMGLFLPADNSTTTLLVKALYYDELQQSTTSDITNSVANTTISDIEKAKNDILANDYTLSQIKTSKDNSIEALKRYGTGIHDIIKKYGSAQQTMTELDIIKKSIGGSYDSKTDTLTPDTVVIAKLDPYIAFYTNTTKALLQMVVPSEQKKLHLDLINAYDTMRKLDTGFRNFSEDPITAVASLNIYPDASRKYLNAMQAIATIFAEKGITSF